MARVLVHPSLDSLEAVEGTCDQRWLIRQHKCTGWAVFIGHTSLIVGFVMRLLICYWYSLEVPRSEPQNAVSKHLLTEHSQHYILEESNFNFRYILLWDLHIPREKWLNYLQTVETLIRCSILRRLILVCTVCQVPFYGSPNYNGLISGSLLPHIQQFSGTSTRSEKDLYKFYDKSDKK